MALNITWKGSPNKSSNSFRKPIDRIVIHWFGIGTLESANAQFHKPKSTSAHYGVSDKTIYQWVKENEVAWHAGNWAINQRSIGIENDATTSPDANPHDLSEESYKTSAALLKDVAKRYNIPLDRQHIIKHSEVKATQCSGTVDLDRLIALAKGENAGMTPAEEYGNAIRKSVAFDETVLYLELGDPNKKGFEDVKKVIAGLKGRANDLENQLEEKVKELAVAETEIKNQKDKIANLKRDCQTELDTQKAYYETLIAGMPTAQKLQRQYGGIVSDLKGKLRAAEKAGGEKDKQIARLKVGQPLTCFETIFNFIFRR